MADHLFPEGPWNDEPDEIVWDDEVSGLSCMARRAQGGHWCGYVALPSGHPWNGKGIEYLPGDLDIHGGISYASASPTVGGEPDADGRWWIGFSCDRIGDLVPAIQANLGDFAVFSEDVYRDEHFVRREITDLAHLAQDAA